MSLSYSRFKVNALIQLARTTEISSERERYVTLAEQELNKECPLVFDSIDKFLSDCVRRSKNKNTLRTEIYDKYLNYCLKNNFTASTKNVLYRVMRENGFTECVLNGNACFRCNLDE